MSRPARAAALAAGVACACAGPAAALDLRGRLAVGVQAGTTGPGVESQLRVSERLVLRGAIEGFSGSTRIEAGGVTYRARGRWLTDSGMVDFHPAASPWMISAGAYYGLRRVRVSATADGLGAVAGRAKLPGFAPFVGAGWDNTFHGERRWGFKARAGVILSGGADVDLTSTAAGPEADARLRALENELRQDLKPAQVWPVVQAGVNLRF